MLMLKSSSSIWLGRLVMALNLMLLYFVCSEAYLLPPHSSISSNGNNNKVASLRNIVLRRHSRRDVEGTTNNNNNNNEDQLIPATAPTNLAATNHQLAGDANTVVANVGQEHPGQQQQQQVEEQQQQQKEGESKPNDIVIDGLPSMLAGSDNTEAIRGAVMSMNDQDRLEAQVRISKPIKLLEVLRQLQHDITWGMFVELWKINHPNDDTIDRIRPRFDEFASNVFK